MKLKWKMIINIPFKINIIIYTDKMSGKIIKVYLFNKSKKIVLYFLKSDVHVDKWCNTLKIDSMLVWKNSKTTNFFKEFFKSWDTYFFKKIRFKGKGFRIKMFKKIKLIKFFFGKSHKTFLLLKKTIKKRVNKYKFIVFNINKNRLTELKKYIDKIKYLDVYTLRGLRFSKQIIFKRKGKKGTYI